MKNVSFKMCLNLRRIFLPSLSGRFPQPFPQPLAVEKLMENSPGQSGGRAGAPSPSEGRRTAQATAAPTHLGVVKKQSLIFLHCP